MPAGRPTKYTSEIQQQAEEYIEHYSEPPHDDKIPSIVGMAIALGVTRSTLYKWAEEGQKSFSGTEYEVSFSDTLEKCNDYQHKIALNKGISSEFNSTITKLVLANHGYSERHLVGGDGEAPININIEGKDAEL